MELRTMALIDSVIVQSLSLVRDDFSHGGCRDVMTQMIF